jgi:hypothetical protein
MDHIGQREACQANETAHDLVCQEIWLARFSESFGGKDTDFHNDILFEQRRLSGEAMKVSIAGPSAQRCANCLSFAESCAPCVRFSIAPWDQSLFRYMRWR